MSQNNDSVRQGPPNGRTVGFIVHLMDNQFVEVRLNDNSPWMFGIVLGVLNLAEKNLGIGYDVQYHSGNRCHRKTFPADSPNIRARAPQ
ncbi:hypothetical protein FB45DRAFT_1049982 [Roridomyces roridus]|uniref:Uncharacterized protein n=1 Tax=Roridomyces roridus TaxID=1738132 RepID=A0AAD7CI55_9AGAR|nr:hypothetical protein FB45DRAFT_1049982 [Roridomyces roridus]